VIVWIILGAIGIVLAEKYISGFGSDPAGKLAAAIASAEGFGPVANLPTRANNPGDLELGDLGHGTIGAKTVFGSLTEGIAALKRQINLIVSGDSQYYSTNMTISQMAKLWTGGDNADAWAQNVASSLGVTPDTTLEQALS
jgi:hypothetical protein